MKKLFTLLAVLCVASSSFAQTPLFKAGDEVVSLGVGIGSDYGMPISVSYEMGYLDLDSKSTIGIGGTIAYAHENFNDETGNIFDSYAYNGLTIAATGSYHYDLVDGFDLFATAAVGYTMAQISASKNDVSGSLADNAFYYGISVGGRYYFSDDLAAHVKLGATATSFLEVGVSYRFSVKSLLGK
ncbi:MAG: hypothetical protein SNH94_07395 [Rikenellaceae bacterium]